MTKLEEEMKQAIVKASWENESDTETNAMSKAAAEVAKTYILRALEQGVRIGYSNSSSDDGLDEEGANEDKKEWLTKIGIV